MGIMLWMWLVLAFPVALIIDMLMTPKGNRDEADDRHEHRDRDDGHAHLTDSEREIQRQRLAQRGSAAMARDHGRLTDPQDEEDINRQREQDRIRMANRGGRHVPAQ